MQTSHPLAPLLGDMDSPRSAAVCPPLILPGGGRFAPAVQIAVCSQSVLPAQLSVCWRFSMNPTAKSDNGPSFEGRIPARPDRPFESCYTFSKEFMGYRKALNANLEFSIPGVYRVYAWIEDANGVARSKTQFASFQVSADNKDHRGA